MKTAEQNFSDALSILRADYYGDIRSYAEEIKQEIKDGEIEDRDSLSNRVWEVADGTQWVIYTQKAQIVLLCSDNDNAYADEFGTEGVADECGGVNWLRLAFAAVHRDIFEQLEAEGVNVYGDTREEMLGEEEEEDSEESEL